MQRAPTTVRRATPFAIPISAWVPLLSLVLAPGGASAQGAAPATDPVLPVAAAKARVDAVFAAYDRTDSPGCALGVMRAGDLVYARGYGMASLELRRAIGPSTVFRTGSVSKQFTAAAIVLAEQEGYLSLDDDIRTYLPEMPEYERPITIRMLLHHTSGIRDYIALMDLAGLRVDDWYSIDEAYRIITRQRATNFPPGDEHLYSNSGYFLLSQIIERATGSSLHEFADEHIFRPLGMLHTHFHDDHRHVVPERASGYAPRGDGFRLSMTDLDMVGDGGVLTSIEDLARWDANFYEPTVGGRAFLDAMLTRGILANGDTIDYALGLFHGEYRGLPIVQHSGAFVGFRAQILRFPEERFTVAVECNLSATVAARLAAGVADVFLEDILAPEAPSAGAAGEPEARTEIELPSDRLERWVGLYRRAGGYTRIEMRNGRLTVAVGPGYTLHPYAEDRFFLEEVPATFEFRVEDGTRRYTLSQASGVTEGEGVEEAAITPDVATAYAGRYHSDELGVDYLVTADGTTLRVERGRQDPIVLVPTVPDEFTLEGASVRFERVGDRPAAFTIDAGRVLGIRFERLGG